MSDIIKIAQDLRSEFNNERQDWLRERGGERIEMPLDCTVLYGDNDARDVIGELAEETWEYSAQDKRGEDWETFTNSETHIEEWWADKDDAEWAAIISQEQGHETRLVRRRVSEPEVINE